MLKLLEETMNNRIIAVFVILIGVSVFVGCNQFFLAVSQRAYGLAVIEDVYGNQIGVEPVSNEVWNTLVKLSHSGEEMWIGGKVETFLTFVPDPNYRWGFRFKSETITVAEITAEGLQSTIRDISENLDYWLDIGYAYVFAKVTEIHYSS